MIKTFLLYIILFNLFYSQKQINDKIHFDFDKTLKSISYEFQGSDVDFEVGIEGQSIVFNSKISFQYISLDDIKLDGTESFSVQFWLKTTSTNPMIFLSQKDFKNKGITNQKNAGWAIYSSGGTFAWTIGSGKRRLNYERDNGQIMPINDGNWHQITMTFDKKSKTLRLYYDGMNKAIYNVDFNFSNDNPIVIGSKQDNFNYDKDILAEINEGKKKLQNFVNEFNNLAVGDVEEDEFFSLMVDHKALYLRKLSIPEEEKSNLDDAHFKILDKLNSLKREFHSNPYTVSQIAELTALKPVSKLYELKASTVTINKFYAMKYTEDERIYPADFSMDNLTLWKHTLSAEEILNDYHKVSKTKPIQKRKAPETLTVAVWNIWHGGTHFSIKKDGWDSRLRVAELFKKLDVDVILMQESYSNADFIAAELGYYFAESSDWDYKMQGSNISVISRYPISELNVPEKAAFMNVSAKIMLSESQEIYAMSNWYGMSSFPIVYNYHEDRFNNANTIPVLFGGDFNVVPHTDGGDSQASRMLMKSGFIDAFRTLHPDVKLFPGYTHQWGERIDQLFFKGNSLKLISSNVISTANGGLPSDHFMILSKFVLND